MRFIIIITMSICILLSGCEYFIPHTSDALSQSKQLRELQEQSKQIKRQTDALERLSNSAEKLANPH
ncbi:MAG: hypothetical protein HC908_03935 [Calothrix sp. SM1_7_51]|nr:hypothetical protein [Calothrix sp. SM1_7_51]